LVSDVFRRSGGSLNGCRPIAPVEVAPHELPLERLGDLLVAATEGQQRLRDGVEVAEAVLLRSQ
jgi:hypothetical protein